MLWVIIIIFRLLLPVIILRYTVAGVLLATIADIIDYQVFIHSPVGPHNYQYLDKFLDTYYLAFLLFISLRWKDELAKKISIGLFTWRVTGVAIFYLTKQEYVLLLFPNVFEYFFFIYVLFTIFTKQITLIRSRGDIAIIVGGLTITKILEEYGLHVERIFYNAGPDLIRSFYSLPGVTQMLVFAVIPLAILSWKIAQAKRIPVRTN